MDVANPAFRALNFLDPIEDPGSFSFYVTLLVFQVLLVAGGIWSCCIRRTKGSWTSTCLYLVVAPALLGSIVIFTVYSMREFQWNREMYGYHGPVDVLNVTVVSKDSFPVRSKLRGIETISMSYANIQVDIPTCSRCQSAQLSTMSAKRKLCEASCIMGPLSDQNCIVVLQLAVQQCVDTLLSEKKSVSNAPGDTDRRLADNNSVLDVYGDCNSCSARVASTIVVAQSTLLAVGSVLALSSIVLFIGYNVIIFVFCTSNEEFGLEGETNMLDDDLRSVGIARTVSISSIGGDSLKSDP